MVKWLRRIFGVLDTSLTIAILSVSTYWLGFVLQCKYVRVIDKSLEDYSLEIRIASWVMLVSMSIIMLLLKYYKLKKKKAVVNILWFIGATAIFIICLQCSINYLCNKYDAVSFLSNKI